MRSWVAALALLCLAMNGCALKGTAPASVESPVAGAAIQGIVHGGQQPVANAHVYLFAAGTSGYGGNGIAASSSNASVSVFTSAETGQSDSVGLYITTTSNGNFTFPSYTCTPGTQLYIYVLGGNPGNGTNSALGLMAALGNCPVAGNVNTTVPYISINEITTVAAAYALAGFATDATHIGSSGTALAQTGIANAFLNATNLANIATGAALATTPSGNGTVPQREIEYLADILAYCVNSNDAASAISSECSTLFGYTLSGGTTGSTPTDTASAAINIAHNPAANVGSLFSLVKGTSPYAVPYYAEPKDWTIAITFGLVGSGNTSNYSPTSIAIDASGNVWIPLYFYDEAGFGTGSSVVELSAQGAVLSGSGGYTSGGISGLGGPGIAIDHSGNAWLAGSGLVEINSSGTAYAGSPVSVGGGIATAVAVDGTGNVWVANYFNGFVKFTGSGSFVGTYGGGAADDEVMALAIDGAGNVWGPTYGGVMGIVVTAEVSNSGLPISPATGYTGGGESQALNIAVDRSGAVWIPNSGSPTVTKRYNSGSPASSSGYTTNSLGQGSVAIAIDGAGNVWTQSANAGAPGISELSSTGALISPSTGYHSSSTGALAVDGSGNLWSNSGVEVIGIATPVITPICAGLPSTPTTDGSSNLGTRP